MDTQDLYVVVHVNDDGSFGGWLLSRTNPDYEEEIAIVPVYYEKGYPKCGYCGDLFDREGDLVLDPDNSTAFCHKCAGTLLES